MILIPTLLRVLRTVRNDEFFKLIDTTSSYIINVSMLVGHGHSQAQVTCRRGSRHILQVVLLAGHFYHGIRAIGFFLDTMIAESDQGLRVGSIT